jgi:hypothetical protein
MSQVLARIWHLTIYRGLWSQFGGADARLGGIVARFFYLSRDEPKYQDTCKDFLYFGFHTQQQRTLVLKSAKISEYLDTSRLSHRSDRTGFLDVYHTEFTMRGC